MRDRLRRVGPRPGRPVDDVLAAELLSGELGERPSGTCSFELARGVDHGVAAEHGGPRRGRLAGLEVALGVDERLGSGFGARPSSSQAICREHGVDALAHLRPGVVERHRPVGLGPQDRLAVLRHAVADPGVLRNAGDAGEARAAVGVAHGEQGLLDAHARAELLPGAEAVAHVEGVAPADLPAVDARPARRACRARPRSRSSTG